MGVIAQNWFNTGWRDDQWLNEWEIPFGRWVQESIDWLNVEAEVVFDIIRWPFANLLELVTYDILLNIPWPFMLLLFAIIGFLVRDVKIGLGAAAGIFMCGVLGADYWLLTMQTIGIMSVSVIICVAIGLPYGVLCARSDRVWNLTRPVLDGMQLVHAFTYLIAIIFFFGTGPVGGAISTMVFALPPMIRLTNLGIRQVPGDVVEAAQAYGASDFRVLIDVQLPLARSAIMTGVNQVLLLSLSFVGIIAVIAGGGLGQEIFRGIQSSNAAVGAASGLALYLVGVVLDRLSQPQPGDNRTLIRKMGAALRWDYEIPPSVATSDVATHKAQGAVEKSKSVSAVLPNDVGVAGIIGLVGGALAVVSVFLTWVTGAGRVSGYARPVDLSLNGTFTGYDASGGSWFGLFVLFIGTALLVLSMLILVGRKRSFTQWPFTQLSSVPEGGVLLGIVSVGALIVGMMVVYLFIAPHDLAGPTEHGVGVFVALLGGLVLIAGGAIVYGVQGHVARRIAVSPILVGLAVAVVGLLVISSLANWVSDSRPGALTPQQQLQIEIERVNPTDAGTAILNQNLSRDDPIHYAGFDASGPNLSVAMIWASVVVMVLALVVFAIPRFSPVFEALLLGFGGAVLLSITAWVVSFLRVADNGLYTGAAGLPALAGGVLIVVVALSRMRQRGFDGHEAVESQA
ncbi:MAG: ABC transporter permease subunit [Acidimicrobiia bacterium]|nr:ABC transporter permease subunit [Acidimicrobiia bacterium]MYC58275.1 ABC transporter permease subunit [Acidimicrobiia bacterium]MYG93949.1 ABC transporter permease subunit [Acidimicrobiia bacterium]MYI30967.1 ABC transporter permease subunit [Acidimicrobiia bacterium]